MHGFSSEGSLASSQCNKSPWNLQTVTEKGLFACYIPKRIGIVLVGFLVFFALASFLLARKMWAKPCARERLLQGQNWIPHAHAVPANLDLSPAGTQSRLESRTSLWTISVSSVFPPVFFLQLRQIIRLQLAAANWDHKNYWSAM
jgi:hypothetical protein